MLKCKAYKQSACTKFPFRKTPLALEKAGEKVCASSSQTHTTQRNMDSHGKPLLVVMIPHGRSKFDTTLVEGIFGSILGNGCL